MNLINQILFYSNSIQILCHGTLKLLSWEHSLRTTDIENTDVIIFDENQGLLYTFTDL